MVQFGTLTATTLSSSPKYGSIAFPPADLPHPDPSQMSADDRKRKLDAIKPSRGRRDPHGSANAPSAPQRGMSVEEAKALLERAGVSKKHGKKDKHGKKEKKKKDKHSKREKKKRRRKDRDSDSDSDSDSESSDGGRGARRWKSGVEKTSKKGKVKDDWGPLPGPDFAIETISDEDYYLKNREFAAWLKRDRGVYFTDLSAAEARTAFKSFIVEWNERQLPMKFYEEDGIVATGRR